MAPACSTGTVSTPLRSRNLPPRRLTTNTPDTEHKHKHTHAPTHHHTATTTRLERRMITSTTRWTQRTMRAHLMSGARHDSSCKPHVVLAAPTRARPPAPAMLCYSSLTAPCFVFRLHQLPSPAAVWPRLARVHQNRAAALLPSCSPALYPAWPLPLTFPAPALHAGCTRPHHPVLPFSLPSQHTTSLCHEEQPRGSLQLRPGSCKHSNTQQWAGT